MLHRQLFAKILYANYGF